MAKTKTLAKVKKKHAAIPVTSENKCDLCTGSICCTYITHEINTPRSMEDFDYLLWQISHHDVSVFKDDDGWFLSVNTPCRHLASDGRCKIYSKRPQICREHTNDCCEFDGPAEEDFDLYFKTYKMLDDYCRERFKRWDGRFEKWAKDA